MKKALSMLLALVMMLALLPMGVFSVSAATSGYYTYTVSNGKATITDVSTSISGSVTIPSTLGGYPVTAIGSSAFSGCNGLTTVTIPDSVTSIGFEAFEYCTSLKTVTIPDSVTSIGNYAFYNTALYNDSTNWENGVLYIGNHLIDAKDSISGAYTIKTGTKTIADYAFRSCTSLTTVTIPDSVTTIGDGAFNNCTILTKIIVVPNNSTYCSIDGVLFSEDTTTLIKYPAGKTESSYVIPDSVTTIGYYAFYSCASLTSVTIPDSVTSIGEYAFAYCTSLTTVTIPDSVTSIGVEAFRECTSLRTVNYNAVDCTTMGSISYPVFRQCSSLTTIKIGEQVKTIPNSAFCGCSSLTSVTIPDSVTSIGVEAFRECTSLRTVNYNAVDCTTMGSISYPVFRQCSSLTTIKIGEQVKTIPNSAFYECYSLITVTIPDSVTTIGEYAFAYCTRLTSVYITDIAAWCNIDFANSIANPLYYAKNLYLNNELVTDLVIPDSVTSIGYKAFYNCKSLTTVTIPDNVTSIGEYAFAYCTSLTTVTIPDSVTSIRDYAFSNCSKLRHVAYNGTAAKWSAVKIGTTNSHLTTALCPEGTVSSEVTPPSCGEEGSAIHTCSKCGYIGTTTTAQLGHTFVNGTCTACSTPKDLAIGTSHPYSNNEDLRWKITKKDAKRIALTFSKDTLFMHDFWADTDDRLYIYDGNDDLVGTYYGSELAGKRLLIEGDTVNLRFTSDSGTTGYGFEIVRTKVYYKNCTTHKKTEVRGEHKASCTKEGFSGTTYCLDCGETVSVGYNTPTIAHPWKSLKCNVCNQEALSYEYDDYMMTATVKDCYENYSGKLVIPSAVGDYKVKTIAKNAFSNCDDLTFVIIPNSVTSIKEYAFSGCDSLKEITILNATCSISDSCGLHDEQIIYGYKGSTAQTFANGKGATFVGDVNHKHSFAAATCTKPATCKACGITTGQAKGGHSYAAATCTKAKTCKTCGVTTGVSLGHSYVATTTKATLSKNGSIVKMCTVCGKVASKTTIKYAKTVKLSTTSYTYNGKAMTPSVTVKDSAGKALKKNTDYTVTYASGRKNVGTYKVTIKGKGNYSFTKTLTFTINPPKTTVKSLTAGTKSLKVSITKKSSQVTGYEVQYSTSKKFTKATTKAIKSYKTTSYTLRSLSAKKTYYVRVRTYKTVNGKKYYSGWSSYKYKKTK